MAYAMHIRLPLSQKDGPLVFDEPASTLLVLVAPTRTRFLKVPINRRYSQTAAPNTNFQNGFGPLR